VHPIALLAHGATASKETLFRFAEALAIAGFDCYAIDLPGHGASQQVFSIQEVQRKPAEVARIIGPVDVFVGHSMGAGAGAWSVWEAGFRPKLFIAAGANPDLGDDGPSLCLLAGRFDEFHRPAQLMARTNAQVVISPRCDHILEPYDSFLVNAGVQAACASIGKTASVLPTAWLWRLAGFILGMTGGFILAFCLPELHPRLAQMRGLVVPVVIIIPLVLASGTWIGAAPHLRRIPLQLVLMAVTWLVLIGISKIRLPRWSLVATAVILTFGCALVVPHFTKLSGLLVAVIGMSTVFLFWATIVGWIGARGGSRRAGDMAMAIFAGYVIGQCVPLFV
jgi:pimeloyl-ACP methyl ester carboxylesterase